MAPTGLKCNGDVTILIGRTLPLSLHLGSDVHYDE